MQPFIANHCQKEKKMKIKLPLICIIFILSLNACKKATINTDEVYIRIENTTTEYFNNFALNGYEFGSIAGGDTSKYVLCKTILPIPFANLIAVNNNPIYIVDIVPTPYLTTGKYLMKVVSDTTSFRYQASFIKE